MSRQFSFQEAPDSRSESTVPPKYELIYIANGIQDDATVHAIAIASTPNFVVRQTGVLWRQDVKRDVIGWNTYRITVPYGPRDREVGSVRFAFDTTGATVHISAAKEHVATYASSGLIADDCHKGAIGVKEDGDVEGIDIVIPVLKMSYTYRHPQAVVNEAFARNRAAITGYINNDSWRGFAAGELLFLGSSGSDGSDAEAEVTDQFAASGNTTTLSIGGINDIAKKGHDAIWIEFQDAVDNDRPVRQPERVHVERVYDEISFTSNFGY